VFTRQFLFVGFILTTVLAGFVSVQPAPKKQERPVIKCELSVTGKLNDRGAIDGAEIVITNQSAETIDIGGYAGARGNLDLKVTGPDGKAVMTNPLSSLISPFAPPPAHFAEELKPGKSHRLPVSLLVMVPEKDRVTGKYKVKATFKYDGRTFESNEAEVNWPGDKK